MSKEQAEQVEMLVKGRNTDQWEYAVAKEIRVSETSRRIAYAIAIVLALSLSAIALLAIASYAVL